MIVVKSAATGFVHKVIIKIWCASNFLHEESPNFGDNGEWWKEKKLGRRREANHSLCNVEQGISRKPSQESKNRMNSVFIPPNKTGTAG